LTLACYTDSWHLSSVFTCYTHSWHLSSVLLRQLTIVLCIHLLHRQLTIVLCNLPVGYYVLSEYVCICQPTLLTLRPYPSSMLKNSQFVCHCCTFSGCQSDTSATPVNGLQCLIQGVLYNELKDSSAADKVHMTSVLHSASVSTLWRMLINEQRRQFKTEMS